MCKTNQTFPSKHSHHTDDTVADGEGQRLARQHEVGATPRHARQNGDPGVALVKLSQTSKH